MKETAEKEHARILLEETAKAHWIIKRELKHLRKSLSDLHSAVEQSVKAIDAEMKKPSDFERGRRMSIITNFLDYAGQSARRFGLRK